MQDDKQQNSPTRAESIRVKADAQQQVFMAQIQKPISTGSFELAQIVGLRLCELLSYLPVIAAELAERNEHDTAAEARAAAAETFVRGIEAQLGLSSGLVTPQGKPAVKVPTR